jgi:hypothetical protein
VKSIRAYDCTRKATGSKRATRTAICLVLDAAHASHTMRVFLRDQAPGAVVRALPRAKAAELLADPTMKDATEWK